MFTENKFTAWYYQLIDRANSRTVDPNQYYETHHIIPRCMGGSDAKSNLVRFTAREHYIAHMLLVKMTTGPAKRKMSFGLWKMISANKVQDRYMPCNRQYEIIKQNMAQAISEQNKGQIVTEEQKEKLRNRVPWNKGKTGIYSEETLQLMSLKSKQKMMSEEARKKISDGVKRRYQLKVKTGIKGSRPRIKFVLKNTITNEIIETNNLRNWCKEHKTNTAYIYTGRSDWKVIAKYSLKTGELIK